MDFKEYLDSMFRQFYPHEQDSLDSKVAKYLILIGLHRSLAEHFDRPPLSAIPDAQRIFQETIEDLESQLRAVRVRQAIRERNEQRNVDAGMP